MGDGVEAPMAHGLQGFMIITLEELLAWDGPGSEFYPERSGRPENECGKDIIVILSGDGLDPGIKVGLAELYTLQNGYFRAVPVPQPFNFR
jgi:hypothetical protein